MDFLLESRVGRLQLRRAASNRLNGVALCSLIRRPVSATGSSGFSSQPPLSRLDAKSGAGESRMKTSRICTSGLLVVLGLPVGLAPAEELFLPPAGKDVFPATRAVVRLQLDVLRLGPAAKGLVTANRADGDRVEWARRRRTRRSQRHGRHHRYGDRINVPYRLGRDENPGLDPTQRSLGEIQGDPENPFHADSFFDVFFEIEVPQLGVLRPVDIDGQPTPVRMSSTTTIGHIPPIGSVYFGEQPREGQPRLCQ